MQEGEDSSATKEGPNTSKSWDIPAFTRYGSNERLLSVIHQAAYTVYEENQVTENGIHNTTAICREPCKLAKKETQKWKVSAVCAWDAHILHFGSPRNAYKANSSLRNLQCTVTLADLCSNFNSPWFYVYFKPRLEEMPLFTLLQQRYRRTMLSIPLRQRMFKQTSLQLQTLPQMP